MPEKLNIDKAKIKADSFVPVAGAVKSGNLINRGISMVIYGDPGVGKTTLATTLPPDETIIINSECGLGPLLGNGHRVFNLHDNLGQLDDIYKILSTTPVPYVVIDNISEMEQWMINTLTRGRRKDFVELKEYGDSAYKMREYIRLFRDLVFKNTTVVFNAWEQPLEIQISGGEVKTKAFPKLNKKLSIELCGLVDVVARLERYPKTGDRYLRTDGTNEIEAKCQFRGVDKFEQPDLTALIKKIYAYDYSKKEEV